MKRTKRLMVMTLLATTLVALTMMSRAFAAPLTQDCTKESVKIPISTNSGSLNDLQDKLKTLLERCNINSDTMQAMLNAMPKAPAQPAQSSAPVATAQPTVTAKPVATAQPTVKPTATAQPTAKPTATAQPAAKPTATTQPTAKPTAAPVSGNMTSEERKMIELVNGERTSAGLPALTFDATLRTPAIAHSQDMSQNNFFSHTSPTKGDFSTRLKASGVRYSTAGENLAMYGSVEKAHVGLMNSSGHRANIMNANYTRIGIGIVYNSSKGAYYITQWFAK